MKSVEITENLLDADKETLVALVGDLITVAEDVAYAYDIEDEMNERICEALTEHDIKHRVMEDDI